MNFAVKLSEFFAIILPIVTVSAGVITIAYTVRKWYREEKEAKAAKVQEIDA